MFRSLLTVSSLFAFGHGSERAAPPSGESVLANSCNDLADGEYWLKLVDSDEYPVVKLRCSNGFAILDYSKDNAVSEYFDTFLQWFPATAGPSNDIHPNWGDWFTPGTDDTRYLLSPDCGSCEASSSRQLYDAQTTYWMTGSIFGCFWNVKGLHNCDYDYDTTDCYTCASSTTRGLSDEYFTAVDDETTADEYDYTGICPHNVRSSDYYTPQTHDSCSQSETVNTGYYHLKPSLGIEGKYCVCFQQARAEWFTLDREEVVAAEKRLADQEEEEATLLAAEGAYAQTDIYMIRNEDFKTGTYRITKPGIYKVMEDITFDFNANKEDPNDVDAYVPTQDQAEEYPGAGDFHNAYFMGFFAGITVECDDVTLDLGGHTLKMSDYFYLQQRWFTTIELSTQYFLPGQGIGNFGGDPTVANNVIVKNGIIRQTSHHGIHGNYNKNVEIRNIIIEDWETHGLQLNGFEDIKLIDIEIGKTSSKIALSGEYAHMRMMLSRYKRICDELDDDIDAGFKNKDDDDYYISFYGREEKTTMREITEEVELQMNMAFDYVTKGVVYDEQDEYYDSFVSAKKLFVSENGIPYGAAQYGIFLNTFGASVFTYNLDTYFYSSTAYLENIKIHGLRHQMKEYSMIRETGTANALINPFNGPLNAEELIHQSLDDEDAVAAPEYKGNILLDGYIAANKFSDSINYLQLQIVKNDFVLPWATGDDLTSVSESFGIVCAVDVMVHTGKGINGLRLDGIEDVYMKNVEVYDLHDTTPVGNDYCGSYSISFRQTLPMQTGFSGNMNQAININAAQTVTIENARIDNIVSDNGPAFGISIWPACDVTLKGDISVSNMVAGKEQAFGTYGYGDLPNAGPEVCAVRVYYDYTNSDNEYFSTTFNDDDARYNIGEDSLQGHYGCMGSTNKAYLDIHQFKAALNEKDDDIEKAARAAHFGKTETADKFERKTFSKSSESTPKSVAGNAPAMKTIMTTGGIVVLLVFVAFLGFFGLGKFFGVQMNQKYEAINTAEQRSYLAV